MKEDEGLLLQLLEVGDIVAEVEAERAAREDRERRGEVIFDGDW